MHSGREQARRTPSAAKILSGNGGSSFVSVVLVLLIIGGLYLGYVGLPAARNERSVGVAAIDGSKAVACRVTRQQIERDITMWAINHPGESPTIDDLEADGLRVPSCPDGGEYEIHGRSVYCSLHR
jgi:competence protein ComGC